MISRAVARYIRISPRKARQVTRLVQGENAQRALVILSGVNKGSAGCIAKVLKSAVSNAKQKPEINEQDLYISKVVVDKGPMLKRFRPRAMGRAAPILKRTSHITVELDKKPPKRQMGTEVRRQKTENER